MQSPRSVIVAAQRRGNPQNGRIRGTAIGRDREAVVGKPSGKAALRKGRRLEQSVRELERLYRIVVATQVKDWPAPPFPISHVEDAEADGREVLHDLSITWLRVTHIPSVHHVDDAL